MLIEDAAESLAATYKGRQTGTFGQYNALSFNGNKIITTSGGGMLLSDDEEAIAKARFWSTQSREPFPWYEHKEIGYNYRMSNIVAGIGRGQLLHLQEHRDLKEQIYRTYEAAFQDLPLTMNPYLPESRPNFWLSCMTIDPGCAVTPEQVRLALEAENIESRPIWKPMHLQPVFAAQGVQNTGRMLASLTALQELGLIEEQDGRWLPVPVTTKQDLASAPVLQRLATMAKQG